MNAESGWVCAGDEPPAAMTGGHVWADRFEGTLDDIRVAGPHRRKRCGAIAPQLERAEIKRAKRKSTESLDASDSYLRGNGEPANRNARRRQRSTAAVL